MELHGGAAAFSLFVVSTIVLICHSRVPISMLGSFTTRRLSPLPPFWEGSLCRPVSSSINWNRTSSQSCSPASCDVDSTGKLGNWALSCHTGSGLLFQAEADVGVGRWFSRHSWGACHVRICAVANSVKSDFQAPSGNTWKFSGRD